MPESGAGNSNARAPEEDYDHGQGALAAEEDRSQRGDDRSLRENGHAEEHKSPRYSASDRGGPDYGSPPRRGSNDYPEDDEEKRHRRRGSRSGSHGSRGRRSNSRSPRGGAGPRQRRDDSRELERDSGPFTQVYVTGFSRSSRRQDIQEFFARGRDVIHEVIMKSRFAFVEFKTPDSALAAVNELHGAEFEGRKLTVQRSCKFSIL